MAVKRSTRRRRQSYHHGDLKRALTSAALSLVAEKGPKGFTLTEAARRAGVSAAAPYRHFADKAELLAAVAEQGFLALHVALGAAAVFSALPESLIFFTASESGAAGAGLMAGFSIALIGLSSAIDKADTTPPIS